MGVCFIGQISTIDERRILNTNAYWRSVGYSKMMISNSATRKTKTDSPRNNTGFRERFRLWDQLDQPKFGKEVIEKESLGHQRYFIYRCGKPNGRLKKCGGWGDRLNGVIKSYLIANLTGRVFKAEFLHPACNMSKYIIQNRVNWSLPIPSKFPKNRSDYNIIKHMDGHSFIKSIRTTNFTTYFNINKTFIYYLSNHADLKTLKKSKLYTNELSWMKNMTDEDAYAAIYKHLFKLSPRLQTSLQTILSEHLPSPKHKLVCVHVRMGSNPSMWDSAIRMSLDNLPTVWSFISNQSSSDYHKVFVMSDSAEVMTSAKEQPFRNRLVTIPGKIVHVDRTKGGNIEEDDLCDGFEKLVLEHHVLMNCDVLVRGHSGLSTIASFIRGSDSELYCLQRTGVISPCLRNDRSQWSQ